jgi:anti-anti-sigma factor
VSDRPPEPFRCDVEPVPGGPVNVVPHGELDLATVSELEAALRELRDSGSKRFVVDLRELTFMDSTGLRLILAWDTESREDGIDFQLVPGPPLVQRLFEITGVLDRLQFTEPLPRP